MTKNWVKIIFAAVLLVAVIAAVTSVVTLVFIPGSGNEISITTPNSSTVWEANDRVSITWSWTGDIARVDIILTRAGYSDHTIVSETNCDGVYSWTIPYNQPEGEYRIEIVEKVNEVVLTSDTSSYFDITSPYTEPPPPPPTTTTPPETTDPPTTPPPTDNNPPQLTSVTFRGKTISRYHVASTSFQNTGNTITFKIEDAEKRLLYSSDFGYAKVQVNVYEQMDLGGSTKYKQLVWEGYDLQSQVTAWDNLWACEAAFSFLLTNLKWGAQYELEFFLRDHKGNSQTVAQYYLRYTRELGDPADVSLEQLGSRLLLEASFDPLDHQMIEKVAVQLENDKGERYLNPSSPEEIFEFELSNNYDEFSGLIDTSPWGNGFYRIILIAHWSNYADFSVIVQKEFVTNSIFEIFETTGFTEATKTSSSPGFTFALALAPLLLLAAAAIIYRRSRRC